MNLKLQTERRNPSNCGYQTQIHKNIVLIKSFKERGYISMGKQYL